MRHPWLQLLRRTPLHPQWLLGPPRAMAPKLAALRPGRVLDVGCADRWVADALPAECDYVALDYPATGGRMYGARPDVFADASHLPFADASFGSVLMLEVLEHLAKPRTALREASRVLAPGGCLVLTMPFLYPVHDAPFDFQRYTGHGLVREVESAGLQVVEVRPNLGSAETAGLLVGLALGGMALEAVRRRSPAMLLVPLVAIAITLTNVLAWVAGKLLPSWPATTAGYELVARKP